MTQLLNISAEDAEEYSQSLAQIGEGWWRQIAWAFRQGIPEALGMSRREWAVKYHGYFKLEIPERQEAVKELASEGMSQPQIADTLGVSQATVSGDINSDGDDSGPINSDRPTPEVSQALLVDETENDGPINPDRPVPEHVCMFVGSDDCECGKRRPVQINDGDEWYTPPWLFKALDIHFALDVCAPLDRTYSAVPANGHLTIEDDGLSQPWRGTVWCNPPYSTPEPWARRMIHHGDGLLLTHIPMNAGWAVDVWETCDAIRLFQAMEFVRPDGTSQRPGYWLQLAAFGPVATEALGRLQPLGAAAFNKRRVASPMWRRAS